VSPARRRDGATAREPPRPVTDLERSGDVTTDLRVVVLVVVSHVPSMSASPAALDPYLRP